LAFTLYYVTGFLHHDYPVDWNTIACSAHELGFINELVETFALRDV